MVATALGMLTSMVLALPKSTNQPEARAVDDVNGLEAHGSDGTGLRAREPSRPQRAALPPPLFVDPAHESHGHPQGPTRHIGTMRSTIVRVITNARRRHQPIGTVSVPFSPKRSNSPTIK